MKKFFNFLSGVSHFVWISGGFICAALYALDLLTWSHKEAFTFMFGTMIFGGICSLLAGDSGFDGSYRDGNDV